MRIRQYNRQSINDYEIKGFFFNNHTNSNVNNELMVIIILHNINEDIIVIR